MRLTRVRLGKLITQIKEKNKNLELTPWDISGINSDKYFFEPSRQVGKDLTKYKIVPQNCFACNLMHVGRDKVLPISLNNTEKVKVVSPAYTVFEINKRDILLDTYFLMMLKSDEKDRYFWYFTDSSVRDGLDWKDFCDIELELPSIEIQQKYVDIYNAMIENQKSYEKGLEDLNIVCEGYIVELKKKYPTESINSYIERKNERNTEDKVSHVMGISTKKEFREPQSRVDRLKLGNYKIVRNQEFTYVPTTDTWKVLAFALNKFNKDIVVSPIYEVFSTNKDKLIPEYLAMWFTRKEFDRYARFHSWGSARETFTWEDMCEVEIPIPSLSIQQSIVNIYKVYQERKEINEKLKQQIKDICPILIKGSIEEARK